MKIRFALTTTNFQTKLLWGQYSWSPRYAVISPKYHDFDHFILNGLASQQNYGLNALAVCDVYYCMCCHNLRYPPWSQSNSASFGGQGYRFILPGNKHCIAWQPSSQRITIARCDGSRSSHLHSLACVTESES